MSMTQKSYVIYGYDLTSYVDEEKLSDWKWGDGEKYFNYQSPGYIQIFDDPASGEHVYLGYCIWYYEKYDDNGDAKIFLSDLNKPKSDFPYILKELVQNEIIKSDRICDPQIICFTEWR